MTRLHVLVGRAVSAILVYEPRIGIQLSDDGQERAEIRKFSAAFDMHRSDFWITGSSIVSNGAVGCMSGPLW